MPKIKLTIEEKKTRRKAASKKWREKNRDKEAARGKKYYKKNIEKVAARKKKYYKENKEKVNARNKKYYKNNKDKAAAYIKKYNESSTGKKFSRINRWKKYGLVDKYNDNYETIYKIYMMQEMCSICYKFFNKDNRIDFKCMDHCHKTGLFRRICCSYCNLHTIR